MKNISRRTFLKNASKSLVGITAFSQAGLFGCVNRERITKVVPTISENSRTNLSVQEWQIIQKVQNHLLPSDPVSPGAETVNAIGYLDAALAGTDVAPSEVTQIKNGVPELEKIALTMGLRTSLNASDEQLEKILRTFEDQKNGDEWLQLVMGFTLEAYLGDPAYGGNPDAQVWQWLGHTPGFPRPSEQVRLSRR